MVLQNTGIQPPHYIFTAMETSNVASSYQQFLKIKTVFIQKHQILYLHLELLKVNNYIILWESTIVHAAKSYFMKEYKVGMEIKF
jgi:hypothetical protein